MMLPSATSHLQHLPDEAGPYLGMGSSHQTDYTMTDEFRMYYYKVTPCEKHFSHDWSECPFAHPGEKATRRCPRTHKYSGLSCPDIKKMEGCPRGETCCFAHNSFEYWLHPSRYRTQFCTFGKDCRRGVCFFAHTIDELRMRGSSAAFAHRESPSLYPAATQERFLPAYTMQMPANNMDSMQVRRNLKGHMQGTEVVDPLTMDDLSTGYGSTRGPYSRLPLQQDMVQVPFMPQPHNTQSSMSNMHLGHSRPQFAIRPQHVPTYVTKQGTGTYLATPYTEYQDAQYTGDGRYHSRDQVVPPSPQYLQSKGGIFRPAAGSG